MSIQFDLYEGDSISRLSRLFALPGQAPVGHAPHPRSLMAVIGDAFDHLFNRLEASEHRRRDRELEGYLAGSGDLAEVERRIRDFERHQGCSLDI
jgi:hypothetical protein